jgi:dissimilatory sulfite reductase (desulfoviridin) alpha/beta subunit
MKILVNGEVRELECRINGIDCSQDLHGNVSNNSIWNDEKECYEMTQDDFDWWEEYFTNKESDEERKAEIIEKFGYEAWETAFNDKFVANDMEDEHNAMLVVFAMFE